MKLTYQGTIDECAFTNIRILERIHYFRQTRQCIFLLIVFCVFSYSIIVRPEHALLGWFGSIYCLLRLLLLMSGKVRTKSYFRKHLIRLRDSDAPFLITIEGTDSGLIHTEQKAEYRFPWTALTDVTDNDGDVEFYFHGAGLVRLPARVFDSQAQREEWIAFGIEKLAVTQNADTSITE